MKDHLCTIIYQDESNPTFQKLIKKWKQAAFHDGKNRIFAGIDEDAINPVIVEDLLPDYAQVYDEEGNAIGQSYIDALVEVLAPIVYAEDRSRPIHILASVWRQLYRHPAYQAFIEENNPQEELTNKNKEP